MSLLSEEEMRLMAEQGPLIKAYLVAQIDSNTGSVKKVMISSEWPMTIIGKDPVRNALITVMAGNNFHEARKNMLKHVRTEWYYRWVARFMQQEVDLGL